MIKAVKTKVKEKGGKPSFSGQGTSTAQSGVMKDPRQWGMKPGSRQIDTPGNFRADSAPQKFADNDAKVIKKTGFSKGQEAGKLSSGLGGELAGIALGAKVAGAGASIAGGVAGVLSGAAVGLAAGAGIRAAGNAAQQAIARKRVKKYGQKGSAVVPNKKITGPKFPDTRTSVGNVISGAKRAFEGEKTFTGTASTVKGMRKDARHYRKNVNKATRVAKRNEAISIKNKRKTESAAISATKVKKTYKTTGQKVKGAIKSVFAGNPEKRYEKKKKRALIKSIRKGY